MLTRMGSAFGRGPRRSGRGVLCLIVALALGLPVSSAAAISGDQSAAHRVPVLSVQAETETPDPSDPVESAPTDPPIDVPTEAPPTEIPPTEILPTDIPPTEVPPTEIPPTVEPTSTATIEPSVTATAAVTATASPTATPSPAITWSVAPDFTCTSDMANVESGGAIVYTCTIAATIVADAAPNLALDLTWDVETSPGSDDWAVDTRFSDDAPWIDAGNGTPLESVDTFTTDTAAETQTIGRTLQFDVRLTRASCVTSDPSVLIRVSPSLAAPDAPSVSIAEQGTTVRENTVTPQLAPIPEPSISFLGPLAFGQVSLPPDDHVAVQASSATLQIDGLDRSCGMWTISVEGGGLSTADGRELDAANLQLISVNGQLALDSPCGLDGSCLVTVIVAGPTSLPSVRLALGFQVIVPADAPLGSLDAPVTATISQGAPP
ncbi:MAG: hypothetical protein QM589_18685 [Thermomicrobiales bacterium]